MVSPLRKRRMWSWQVVVSASGPWACPLIIMPHAPQMPSRQSWSKATGSCPSLISCSLSTSSISRNDMSGETSSIWYVSKRPRVWALGCRQIFKVSERLPDIFFDRSVAACVARTFPATWVARFLLVAPLGEWDRFKIERFFVEHRRLVDSLVLPGADVAKVLVVALGLAFGSLIFLAEMTAARFLAMQRVGHQELRELEEVGHAAGVLEVLVERFARAGDLDVPPEFLAELADAVDRGLEPGLVAGHAAAFPHRAAQVAVNAVDGAASLD